MAFETSTVGAPDNIQAPAIHLDTISPASVHDTLRRHMLVDGFDLVLDMRRSQGSMLFDAKSGKRYIDFFTFFASTPVGMNHPSMLTDAFKEKIFHAAINKPSNSDVYTTYMAEFVDTFSRVGIPSYLPYVFFVSGGALAVENALKAAFDWKVRLNLSRGHSAELGHRVMHFRSAFHGRSGYTMSMTNTDPNKVRYFPKFQGWPRISNPHATFPLHGSNLVDVELRERHTVLEMEQAFLDHPDDIAAIIIEPIQGEGGDNHFRPEFFRELRRLADENDALLIFDEVQTGVGMTGKMWAHQHFVEPDIMSFGKKMQVCGILAGKRLDEVHENVFNVSSRINSTWGGSLVDMVRSQRYLAIIEEERLVENADRMGRYLLEKLGGFSEEFDGVVSNPRGRGLMCAFDLPAKTSQQAFIANAYERGLIILGCGERTIRFRPALNIDTEDLDEGLAIVRAVLRDVAHSIQA
jgi:L-lysine 6-transaminase